MSREETPGGVPLTREAHDLDLTAALREATERGQRMAPYTVALLPDGGTVSAYGRLGVVLCFCRQEMIEHCKKGDITAYYCTRCDTTSETDHCSLCLETYTPLPIGRDGP